MKVRALKKFEGIKDLERDVFPKEGEIWEVSAERADLLLKHGVVELVEEKVEYLSKPEEVSGTIDYNIPEDTELKVEMRLEEKPKKKKTSKK